MEFISILLLVLFSGLLAGYILYLLIGFIEKLRNKKLERLKDEERKLKDEMESEKHRIAENTIKSFRKNYDKLNPIILLDGTKIEFYEEVNEIDLEAPSFGHGWRRYEKFGFTYKIDDKVYNYQIFYHGCMSLSASIYLDYLAFEDFYLEDNQWIMDEVTRIVKEKRLELDKEKQDVLKLKADVLEHWLVKKVGK